MAVVCDVYKSCIIFNDEVPGMRITARIMKSKYCTDNYSRCLCYKHRQDQIMPPELHFNPAPEDKYLDASWTTFDSNPCAVNDMQVSPIYIIPCNLYLHFLKLRFNWLFFLMVFHGVIHITDWFQSSEPFTYFWKKSLFIKITIDMSLQVVG